MPRGWDRHETIIAEIDIKADRLKASAFSHHGRLHFYSGPRRAVSDLIVGPYQDDNQTRATAWAEAHGAMIIEHSPIGKYLDHYRNLGTFKYFEKNPLYVTKGEKIEAALAPWKHLSHLFALSAHGQVTTTVTGANTGGVYYTVELQNTLAPTYHGLSATEFLAALSTPRKKEVEAINLIPFDRILAEYKTNGIKAAHTMIQLGEIRMALHEALETSKPDAIKAALKVASKEVLRSPAEAYKYFLDSHERFSVDWALRMKGTPAGDEFLRDKTPDVRRQRREKHLDQFTSKVLLLIETEIALMPPAARPDFIVPAYVKHLMPK